jgi:phage tail-like protein
MRGLVDGLASPHPLIEILPAMYAEDNLATRFVAAFDEVLAPIFLSLDDFPAYLHPALAPEDFVPFLGSWVSAFDDSRISEARRRELVQQAIALHRVRGTAHGLAATIELACGIRPQIVESGGTSWSAEPGSTPPGQAVPCVVVRLQVPASADVEPELVNRIVEHLRPAHIPARVEIVSPSEGDET